MTVEKYRYRAWLLAIFVLSGFAGLIYQSIWSHYLGLFLGHAAYAQALVLAIFMGGMAAGASWIARAGQKWRNLIRGYAIIEIIIGVFGLAFHYAFINVTEFSYDTLIPAVTSPLAINSLRWVVAAILILPQTILLGMTFPLMSGGLIRRFPGRDGSLLGGLYFTNSIGAAVGALAAVFILLPWIGLQGAMIAAALLNFVVAALAWWLAREPEPVILNVKAGVSQPEDRISRNSLLRVVLFGTALSGAASFIYEIVWIRMLSMAVGSTMHAFELMLASFIAGIAFGGLWVRNQADRTDSPLRLVGMMQIGMGVAALASLAVYANAFEWVGWLIESLAKTDGGYVLFNAGTAAISIAIMLPAAFFAGTTLPLFTIALLREGQGERAIGRVYAWNTLGSIVGVFSAIHLFIPIVGLKLTLCIAAIIDLAIGLALLRMQATNKGSLLRFGMALALSAVALMIAVRIPFDPMKLASGVFRHGKSMIDNDMKVIYYRDGKTASISVTEASDGGIQIATNGKIDAALSLRKDEAPRLDEPTMALAAALPLSMLESPKRVGVIGFGSGLTTHTLLGDSRLEKVDTIEIEEAMIQGARAFGPRVARAYEDPRSNIVIDDAKAHFAGQKEKYDLIISEPSNPWISGVGSLFSKEFYEFIPRHLNEGGLFVQWVQLYEIDEPLVGSILNAMTPAFEDYSAWLSNFSDLLIIASPKGPVPKAELHRLLKGPLAAELARLGIASQDQFSFRQIGDGRIVRGLGRLYSNRPVNSDYSPILGLNAPKTRYKSKQAEAFTSLPTHAAPMLEALNIRKPLSSSTPTTRLNHFVPEMMTRRARALAAELKGEPTEHLMQGLSTRSALDPATLLKDISASICKNSWSEIERYTVATRMREVADLTIALLPPDALQGVWIGHSWLKCKNIPEEFTRVFSLLDAVARRDYSQMELQGKLWFEKLPADQVLKGEFGPIALSNLLLGLAHQERWDDVVAAEKSFGGQVTPVGHYGLQRMLLQSIAIEYTKQKQLN
ncbi:fused MFS/spermidine synthase [Acidovorax sp. LjRoot66]|uniref:fused MFS/spermidine synthase n=1 Tax=Acidovorax sp. LjRoot66 TaxID=3342334 RepID=UPI003ECE8E61